MSHISGFSLVVVCLVCPHGGEAGGAGGGGGQDPHLLEQGEGGGDGGHPQGEGGQAGRKGHLHPGNLAKTDCFVQKKYIILITRKSCIKVEWFRHYTH